MAMSSEKGIFLANCPPDLKASR